MFRSLLLGIFCALLSLNAPAQEEPRPPPPPPQLPTPAAEPVSLSLSIASRESAPVPSGASGIGVLTPDEFTGAARYVVTFPLPPIRGFEPPAPKLWYSSRNGNDKGGMGWTAEFGSIRRSELKRPGIAEFLHQSPLGSNPLVSDGARYQPEVSPPYTRYERVGLGWTMVDQSGTTYRFGFKATHRLPTGAQGDEIRDWLLEEIEDPSGNLVQFDYEVDGNVAYPSRAAYGAHRKNGAIDLPHFIEYTMKYEARPDTVRLVSRGVTYVMTRRLSSLQLQARGTVQKSFNLAYDISEGTGRSLLKSIQEAGADGRLLPPTSFSYRSAKVSFEEPALLSPANPGGAPGLRWAGVAGSQMQFFDPRGDGIAKFCVPEAGVVACRRLNRELSSISDRFPRDEQKSDWGNVDDSLIRLIDLNSDGQVDVCLLQERGLVCWLNNGGRFDTAVAGPAWPLTDPITVGTLRFGDINNDGYVDVCRLGSEYYQCVLGTSAGFKLDAKDEVKGPAWHRQKYISTPEGMVWDMTWSAPEHYQTIALVDIDGDGSDDLCARDKIEIICYLSRDGAFQLVSPVPGPSWPDPPTQTPANPPPPVPPPAAETNWTRPEHYGTIAYPDINGDGLPDVCARDKDGIVCYLNTGGGFELAQPLLGPRWSGATPVSPPDGPGALTPEGWAVEARWRSIAFVDVNGDGRKDACGRASTGYECYLFGTSGFAATAIPGPKLDDKYNGNFMDREYYGTVRFVDYGAEGRPSLCARSIKGIECWRNAAAFGDMLESVLERTGSRANIEYSAGSSEGSRIPVAVPVLKQISYSAGDSSQQLTTRYEYAQGYFHIYTRDFRGFARVTATESNVGGPARRRISHYAQSSAIRLGQHEDPGAANAPMRGRVLKTELIDPQSTAREVVSNEYDLAALGNRFAVSASRTLRTACQGNKCFERSRIEYAVDPFTGNLLEERNFGDPSTSSDDVSKEYTYALGPEGKPTNKVAEIRINRGIGVRQLHRRIAYGFDEQHACSATWISAAKGPTFAVTGRGLVTSVWDFGIDATSSVSLAGYDEYGNTFCAFSGRTGLVSVGFDADTRSYATTTTNALGHVATTFVAGIEGQPSSGDFGLPVRVNSPNGLVSIYKYDGLGRLVRFGFMGRKETSVEYLDFGNPRAQSVRVVSPEGTYRRTYYDGAGRPWKSSKNDASGQEETIETSRYDGLGRVTETKSYVSRTASVDATFKYDFRGRTVSTRAGAATETKFCYFPRRQVTISPGARRVDRLLDAQERVVAIVEYEGKAGDCVEATGLTSYRTSLFYDALDGLTKIQDSDRTIQIEFDSLGRRRGVIDSMLGRWSYTYDQAGLVETATDPGGATASYKYDAIGRVLRKTYSGPGLATQTSDFRYDSYREGIGKLTSRVDSSGTATWLYDVTGKVISTIRSVGEKTYVTQQAYDEDGNLTQKIYPDGIALRFENEHGFLKRVSDNKGKLIEFSAFDTPGRPLQADYRNGTKANLVPSGADPSWCARTDSQICGLDLAGPAGSLMKIRRSLDTERNANRLFDDVQGEIALTYSRSRIRTAKSETRSWGFAYDDRDNLLPGSVPIGFEAKSQRMASLFGKAVVHDGASRVRQVATGGSGSAVRRLEYDSRGFPVRLVEPDGTTVRLVFDDAGTLVQLRGPDGVVDIIEGTTTCSGERCENTLFLSGTPAVVLGDTGKKVTFLHADLLGSVRVITDEAGKLLARYTYDPFGQRRIVTEADSFKHRPLLVRRAFLGAIELPSSGYMLLGQRTYDPGIGRFHQPDQANPGMALLRRSNPYSYSYNNPYTYTDANGQFPVLAAVVIAGAIFGAVDSHRNGGNILEGAIRGGLIAAGGYYVGVGAATIGQAWGVNAYVAAAVGQGLYSGTLSAANGGDFGSAFGRGAVMGLVSAGIGRGAMEIIPTPEVESFAGAFARQVGRDVIRGAASSVIVGAIYRDENLGEAAVRGAMYSAGFNAAQNLALLGVARLVSDGPGRWVRHSFVYRTDILDRDTSGMQLGFATLLKEDLYQHFNNSAPMCVVGNPAVERAWQLLDHEQSHAWQYNALGENFGPAYGAARLLQGYANSPFEQGSAGGFAPKNSPGHDFQEY